MRGPTSEGRGTRFLLVAPIGVVVVGGSCDCNGDGGGDDVDDDEVDLNLSSLSTSLLGTWVNLQSSPFLHDPTL